MVKVIDNFASSQQLESIKRTTINQPLWRFGQKSNYDTQWPMWFINLYVHHEAKFKPNVDPHLIDIVNKFCAMYPNKKILRAMIAGNTYGQDGDVHTDHPNNTHVTMVLYLNKNWYPQWGGQTAILADDQTTIIDPQPGRAVIFPSQIPHIGYAPTRSCGELRTILAVQLYDYLG